MSTRDACAYVTLLTNDDYLAGALTLVRSLRDANTQFPLVVLITSGVSDGSKSILATKFDIVHEVATITASSRKELDMIGRPDLLTTMTKISLWGLKQYKRVVYLDADTLVMQNLDHLFLIDKTIKFAAAPELGYPDCFNSGMMVLTPSTDLYERLLQLAGTMPSFDGGDQGLLNIFFGDGNCQGLREAQTTINEGQEKGNDDLPGVVCLGDCYSCTKSWYRLSYGYNVQLNRVYRMYIPAARRYESRHKVLHFVGKVKPWNIDADNALQGTSHYGRFYQEMANVWQEMYARLS